MPFDITTARPLNEAKKTKFDITTAKPFIEESQPDPVKSSGIAGLGGPIDIAFRRPLKAITQGVLTKAGGGSFVEGYKKGAISPERVQTPEEIGRNFQGPLEMISGRKLPRLGGKGPLELAGQGAEQMSPGNLLLMATGAKTGPALGKKGLQGIATVKDKIVLSPKNALTRAEKLTTEILQPSKGELQGYLARGKKMPAIEEATQVIKKSKNYGELKTNLDVSIKNIMDERNTILSENNRPIGDYTKGLKKYIQELKAKGQATPSEIQQIEDVLAREQDFIKKNTLDRLSGQERKEYLQKLTDTLLQKSDKGLVIDTQPARNRALNELRRGLKTEVEGNNYRVAELNSRYEGLRKAKELTAGQEALAEKAVPQSVMQRLIRFVTRPQDIPGDIARGVLDKQQRLLKKTQDIEKLAGIARKK